MSSREKNAFITGANGAIGRAVAQAFAAEGRTLLLTDRDAEGLAVFAKTLPVKSFVFAHDVANAAQTQSVARAAAEQTGGIDSIVTSAGLYQHLDLRGLTAAQWALAIAVNLDGVFSTIQALLPTLNEGSSIVNIASMAGHRGSIDHTPYATAKGGVLALSRSLAQELAPRTRVNAVSPGLIDTPMMDSIEPARLKDSISKIPMRRLGSVAEVASVVTFLCGPGAAYVTGETIHINGGFYIAS